MSLLVDMAVHTIFILTRAETMKVQFFTELCRLLEIWKTRTSPYNPHCNGQVERFNQTLVSMIKSFLKGKQREWDRNLGSLAGTYHATVHESTGMTPNLLMFGKEN